MRELNTMELEMVGGEGAVTAFLVGAGAGAFAGSFIGPEGAAAGGLIGGVIGVGLYYL